MGLVGVEARSKRANEIMKQVGELREKVSKARVVKTRLKNSDTVINNTLMQWTSRYRAFQASPMSEVVVTDKFEGESAEAIRSKLPDTVQLMNDTQASTEGVQGEIAVQITKLDEYMERLEMKISALMGELAAL